MDRHNGCAERFAGARGEKENAFVWSAAEEAVSDGMEAEAQREVGTSGADSGVYQGTATAEPGRGLRADEEDAPVRGAEKEKGFVDLLDALSGKFCITWQYVEFCMAKRRKGKC